MPVLPLVASIKVSPGLISPRRSAPITIESAGRSFTDPAGLLPSSFARSVLVVAPGMRCSRTSGVLPTNWSSVAIMAWRMKSPALGGAGLRAKEGILLLRGLVVGGFLVVGGLLVGVGFLVGGGFLLRDFLVGGG